MANLYKLQDPTKQYPAPKFKNQPQNAPGLAKKMSPQPDHGETSYVGSRRLPNRKALPGNEPSRDTTLREGELITAVTLPPARFAKNAFYLKARDRNSYAFALISVAAGLEVEGQTIRSAGLAMGGVAHKLWRVPEAEQALTGKPASPENFASAADILLNGAHG
jgi:CO/xanthine dehydrogenase FAD-binding subunit